MDSGYRIFDHTADIGLEAFGADLPELFTNAARAFFEIVIDPTTVKEREGETISAEADDVELLMKEWLSELLYKFTAERRVYARFEIASMNRTSIQAVAHGEALVESRHKLRTDIKAVTYHQLSVKEEAGKWTARVILDV